MTLRVWRIVKARFAATALDGEGARQFGGRWNSPGHSVLYTAQSQALAALEMLVHLDFPEVLGEYRMIGLDIDPSTVETIQAGDLPANWNADIAPAGLRAIGDTWLASRRSPVLQVPSVVIPAESNYLINVAHAEFAAVRKTATEPQVFHYDSRLA